MQKSFVSYALLGAILLSTLLCHVSAVPPDSQRIYNARLRAVQRQLRKSELSESDYSSDVDENDVVTATACTGRLGSKCTPKRLAQFFVPKTASYHRQKAGMHAKYMAFHAAAAPTTLASHAVCGAVGSCFSFLASGGSALQNRRLEATGHLAMVPVRPVLGAVAGAVSGACHAVDAVAQATGVVYHGMQYPIAKCCDLIRSSPDQQRRESKYDRKARNYERKKEKLYGKIVDTHAKCSAALLGV